VSCTAPTGTPASRARELSKLLRALLKERASPRAPRGSKECTRRLSCAPVEPESGQPPGAEEAEGRSSEARGLRAAEKVGSAEKVGAGLWELQVEGLPAVVEELQGEREKLVEGEPELLPQNEGIPLETLLLALPLALLQILLLALPLPLPLLLAPGLLVEVVIKEGKGLEEALLEGWGEALGHTLERAVVEPVPQQWPAAQAAQGVDPSDE